jgi:hypothetical protein
VFGEDVADFNPYREVEQGTHRYGLAFGAGPHMCFGLPLVMGSEGTDGSLVHLLKTVLAAGAEPDPDGPEQIPLEQAHGAWAAESPSYIVRFPVRVS